MYTGPLLLERTGSVTFIAHLSAEAFDASSDVTFVKQRSTVDDVTLASNGTFVWSSAGEVNGSVDVIMLDACNLATQVTLQLVAKACTCAHENQECVAQDDDVICQCVAGFTGANCDVSTDACASQPCANNSTCISNSTGIFYCVCADGFTGSTCEEHLLLCDDVTCFNGTCSERTGLCVCDAGFTGELCDSDLNECMSAPCVNGTCIDSLITNLLSMA